MGSLWNDLRYALRTLKKSPVFTAVAVLSLALGIGANTAIFTSLDQILLRLLPVKEPKELVLLSMKGFQYGGNWGGNSLSYPMYRDFSEHNTVFTGMFCRFPYRVSLGFNGHTERASGELVSGKYFPLLGVGTALGRAFTPDDDVTPDGHPIIMLSYDYWKTRFAGDPSILGKTVIVNGHNYTIAGVAQKGFDGIELGRTTQVGFLATLLAVIGLYGVMAYTVARRTREIGIRMALGAFQKHVVWMVMREVLLLVTIGVVAGIAAAIALTRFVQAQLYGITAHDPMTLAVASLALGAVACAAGYIPAVRASRIDAMQALRYE